MTKPSDLPFTSPLVSEILRDESELVFDCKKNISCWNQCCKNADVILTPYDIVKLKNHLGMTSTEFLKQHTVPYEMDQDGMLGIKIKTNEQKHCLFVSDQGCSVYNHRPSACRYYPLGQMNMKKADAMSDEEHYFVVKEDYCKGHEQDYKITVGEYREQQGVIEYDKINKAWTQIVLKKRSLGPTIGTPSEMSLQLFFMCSYDIDRFKKFVATDNFKKMFPINPNEYSKILEDDVSCLEFGLKLLKQVLFGEETINVNKEAAEQRIKERKPILEQRRQAEIEQWAEKQEQLKKDETLNKSK